jgi:predicted amidophosphoribosyltransferase
MISKRIEREKRTVNSMIGLYCRKHHQQENGLCTECIALMNYSNTRLDKCRFGKEKPVCVRCLVHCYSQANREDIRRVMRYAGPRMIYTHPYLAVMHVIDKSKKT